MIAVQAPVQGQFTFANVDLNLLQETLLQGAELLRKILLQKANNPDFFTVERDEDEDMLVSLEDVEGQVRCALEDETIVHFCVQAHYLLPEGQGEASVTLFLMDN